MTRGLSVPPQPMPGQPPGSGYPQNAGGPHDPQDPLPQKRSHRGRNAVLGVLGALVIIVVILVATSGGGGGSPTPSGTKAQVRPSALRSPTTGVGASFEAGDGRGHTYQMRLDLIMDPVPRTGPSAAPRHGTRLVGVVFTIKALGGSARNLSAARNATVVGSNGKTYRSGASPIPGYPNLGHGQIKVTRGASETGALTFEVPAGVKVSTVRWSAPSGSGSTIQWPVSR